MAIFRGIGGAGDSTTDATITAVTEQATNAANSATAAASSASSASSSASSASTSATNAAASASAASTSETNAAASEAAAAASEAAASSSETAAAASEAAAAASESAASTSETNAAASASTASTAATNAAASASAASTSASNAASSASSASTSASNASTSASAASAAQTAAEAAQAAAEAAQEAIDGLYLGAQASDPSVDLNGNAVTAGDWYYNTTTGITRIYDGSAWQNGAVSTTGFLLAVNNLSDLNNTATARTNLGLGSISTQDSNNVTVTGGTIDGTTIGGTTAAAGSFTTLTTSSTVTHNGGTANGVTYLNGSKVLTSGSALTFDGTNLGIGTSSPSTKLHVSGQSRFADSSNASNYITIGAGANAPYGNASISTTTAGLTIVAEGAGNITFLNNGSEAMRIDASGNVGIGTSSPTTKLHAKGRTQGFGITNFDSTIAVDSDYPRIIFGNSNGSGAWGLIGGDSTSNSLNFYTTNSPTQNGAITLPERMRIDSSGNVGIGTSSPVQRLDVASSNTDVFQAIRSTSSSPTNVALRLQDATTGTSNNDGVYLGRASSVNYLWTYENEPWVFGTNNTERARIDSSGNVGIGTSSSIYGKFDVRVGTDSQLSTYQLNSAPAITAYTASGSSKELRVSGYPLTFSGNGGNGAEHARIDSSGNVGIGTSSPGGARLAVIGSATSGYMYVGDGTANMLIGTGATLSSDSSTPYLRSAGAIGFATGGGTERARIDSSGNVGIGTSSPAVKLDFGVTTNGTQIVNLRKNSNSVAGLGVNAEYGVRIAGPSDASAPVSFGTISTTDGTTFGEKARIDSSGNLLVGTTSNSEGIRFRVYGPGAYHLSEFEAGTTSGIYACSFRNPNGRIGTILISGSSTSYNTTSDYRLKENVVGVTGAAARVQQLNPVRFNFIADPDKTVDGFLAHEVQDVVPEAITGTKDAVDAEGNPEYQGIDQSKLVPLLTAALQEALTKIDSLETRIAALEGN